VLEHRAPKTSPRILHSRGAEGKVGRAVHCAPGLVVQTKFLGLNLIFRALTSAATFNRPAAEEHGGRRGSRPSNLCKCPFSSSDEAKSFNPTLGIRSTPRIEFGLDRYQFSGSLSVTLNCTGAEYARAADVPPANPRFRIKANQPIKTIRTARAVLHSCPCVQASSFVASRTSCAIGSLFGQTRSATLKSSLASC